MCSKCDNLDKKIAQYARLSNAVGDLTTINLFREEFGACRPRRWLFALRNRNKAASAFATVRSTDPGAASEMMTSCVISVRVGQPPEI